MKIGFADILTAFDSDHVIGSKVTDEDGFMVQLCKAVKDHDFSKDRVPGQGFIDLGARVNDFVSAGVGKRTLNPSDYTLRENRGRVSAYLKRDMAEPVTGCACVVYTYEAYCSDPDVTTAEIERVTMHNMTHVIVAVLAFAGPQSPLPPHRFIHNLAGGNKEAQVWTADEIRAKAKEILEYDNEWCVVADAPKEYRY